MLTGNELADMQGVAELAMPGTCVIWRDTIVAGPFGSVGSATASGTAICRVRPGFFPPLETTARGEPGQIVAPSNWIVTVPFDTDVRSDDRIVFAGRVFHPMGGLGATSWGISKRVLCTEINAGSQ